jgi:D-alanyl-lipoteichoic acid acyltransferase DltB (MBOAT superfamily)
MLFNSFDFGIFLFVCLACYFALQWGGSLRAQNRMLLLASYVFYGAWDWRFLGLIAASTLVDYCVALRIAATEDAARRRALLCVSVLTNLGILGFFKYANFFSSGLRSLLGAAGVDLPDFALDVLLPVGISFYTFQTLGYTIDVYRRQLEPTHNLFDFALYVAFFPQLVAGPIERAARLMPQLLRVRRPTLERFGSGCWLILWGLFKKAVIADNVAVMVDMVYSEAASPTRIEVLLATYAFAVQIYCDFSGYTDVARGVARLLGIELTENFRLPYLAANPAEYWQRWHISLSTWLRDYLFLPLGGNRHGRWLSLRNLAITMVLGGLWHGAAWTFVVWGAYHGLLLVVHRLLQPLLGRIAPAGAFARACWRGLRVFVTFQLVCFGYLIFRSNDLSHAFSLLTASAGVGLAPDWLGPLLALSLPLVLMQLAQAASGDAEVVLRLKFPVRAVVYASTLLGLMLLGDDGGRPFVYFQF